MSEPEYWWCVKRHGRYLISTARRARCCVSTGIYIKDGDEVVQISIEEVRAETSEPRIPD